MIEGSAIELVVVVVIDGSTMILVVLEIVVVSLIDVSDNVRVEDFKKWCDAVVDKCWVVDGLNTVVETGIEVTTGPA